MEDILIVVFDSEGSAYEGLNYLNQLDRSGVIDVYAGWVIEKEADGRITEKGWQGNFAFHTISGTAPGLLIGLFGGPAGVGIGPTVGGLTGINRDLHASGVNSHFVNDVAVVLKPGKFAMVADVNEEHVTPIDSRMEAMGGAVFRTIKQDFEDEVRTLEIAQIRAQVDQLKRNELMATAVPTKNLIAPKKREQHSRGNEFLGLRKLLSDRRVVNDVPYRLPGAETLRRGLCTY